MYSDIRILVALTCIIEDEGPRNFDSHLEMRVFWIEKKMHFAFQQTTTGSLCAESLVLCKYRALDFTSSF